MPCWHHTLNTKDEITANIIPVIQYCLITQTGRLHTVLLFFFFLDASFSSICSSSSSSSSSSLSVSLVVLIPTLPVCAVTRDPSSTYNGIPSTKTWSPQPPTTATYVWPFSPLFLSLAFSHFSSWPISYQLNGNGTQVMMFLEYSCPQAWSWWFIL